jgi:peptidylprolyl isomerase
VKVFALIVVSCIALAFAGCGGDSSTGATTEPAATSGSNTAKQASATGSEGSNGGGGDVPPFPHISKPVGPAPNHVVVRDLVKGSGDAIKANDDFSVRYVSFDYKTGDVSEDHWSNDSIFSWTFGPGRVVGAWVKGLPGMRVGGRRELIAPGRLAYNPRYAMIWVVELLSVSK